MLANLTRMGYVDGMSTLRDIKCRPTNIRDNIDRLVAAITAAPEKRRAAREAELARLRQRLDVAEAQAAKITDEMIAAEHAELLEWDRRRMDRQQQAEVKAEERAARRPGFWRRLGVKMTAAGYRLDHTSTVRHGRAAASRYYRRGMLRVRVSDHELPQTREREHYHGIRMRSYDIEFVVAEFLPAQADSIARRAWAAARRKGE